MLTSDCVVGWYSSGEANSFDMWIGEKREAPQIDSVTVKDFALHSLTLQGGTEDIVIEELHLVDDEVVFRFSRRLQTNDARDMDLVNRETYVIWGMTRRHTCADILGFGKDTKLTKHKEAGIVSLNFLKFEGFSEVAPVPKVVRSFEYAVTMLSTHSISTTLHAVLSLAGWTLFMIDTDFGISVTTQVLVSFLATLVPSQASYRLSPSATQQV